ncbi:fas-associated protein [Anaeramoeba flamelloides]|uniref:Fas-associated protein n=1 Tax=Anaeramoeba flamelloides TaxID=1746091 RepID=A0ABQ8YZW4_9EUKA|nr:fas-associated protein [Anaeramoeba flamelloides]
MNILSEKENYLNSTKPYEEKIDNIIIDEFEEENEKQTNNNTKNKENSKKKVGNNRKNPRSFYQKLFENFKLLLSSFKNNDESSFLQEYEDSYGRTHPKFQSGTFKQAFNSAKEQSKFLIIYLHSPEHISTSRFCEQVLCNENIITFLDNNYICFGASVRHSSGFLLTSKFHVTTYPFLAIVTTNSSTQLQILKVFEGKLKPYQLLTGLINTLEQHSAIITAQRTEEEEKKSSREIREQQDREYLETVAKDEERMRIEKEKERIGKERRELELELERLEKERQLDIAKKKKEKKELQKRQIEEKKRNLKPEPNPKTEEGVIRLRVIFPDGEKFSRSFKKQWEMASLFDWVDIQENNSIKPEKYYFVKNYPKTVFSEKNITLEKAGIQNGDSLMVIKK